ncbi:acyltransferase family protein [Novosphingobium sp.]|uniref:acyltransferase family protein n=1 Tax=Novosphingobium sp. TaxID=1874826 RepID=UPI003BAACDEF
MNSGPDASKIRSLHGLRGLMAWWVVTGHLVQAFGWHAGLLGSPELAVDVFILLSGFVIAMLVERKAEAYPAYILRRAFRLFPLYLPLLLVSAALLPVQLAVWEILPPTEGTRDRIALAHAAMAHMPFHLGIHAALLHGLVPTQYSEGIAVSVMAQAWSVSLEWQFYLVAPFLIAALYRQAWLRAWVIVIVLELAARYFMTAFLGAKILLFVAGIATCMAMSPQLRRQGLLIAGLCAAVTVLRDGVMQLVPLGIWGAVMAASLARPGSAVQAPTRLLGSRLAYHMGEISYSIYLIHFIVFFVSVYTATQFGLDGAVRAAVVSVVTIVCTYLGARVCHDLIERPGIQLGARLARGMGGPRPGLLAG